LAEVAEVLAANGDTPAGQLTATAIPGGRSNLTVRLEDGVSAWVLRTPPHAGRTPSAHDVAREFRVTSALAGTGVPVARAVALCEEPEVMGGPFAIAELAPGVTVQSRAELDALDRDVVSAATVELVDVLVRLHHVDHEAIGLGDFARPDAHAERQLRRWSGQWEFVGTPDLDPLAHEVATQLGRELPEQRATGIVHGDFRIDNVLLDFDRPAGSQVTAVLDWELSTLGDPVADVAMMCAYRTPAFDLVIGSPTAWSSPALPSGDELAAAYERAGGVALDGWEFHRSLACYKVAVIAAGIAHRAREGHDAGADSAADAVRPFLELALVPEGV
jgi:aminoglycoside phosphotransferase (APT) family kinase protein